MFIFPAIRFIGHFVLIFFIFLIPVGGGQNLFGLLDNATFSTREAMINKSSKLASKAWSETKNFGKKLFTNASPEGIKKDKIQVKQSKTTAPSKNTNSSLSKVIKREELEHIGEDDMRQLDTFLAD